MFEKADQAYLRFKEVGSFLTELNKDDLRDLVQLLSHHEDKRYGNCRGQAVLDKLRYGFLPMRPRRG